MTHKTLRLLEQVSALKEYLEENINEIGTTKAIIIQKHIDDIWTLACRRAGSR